MTEAGWTGNKVTAECIRDTLREQGNVLSPHVVAQCIDDLLKTDSYQQGRVEELEEWQQIVAGTQDRQDLIYRLSDHLTQRTAERDTARRRVDELEAREVDVVLLRDDLEQRTAELEAAKRERDKIVEARQNMLQSMANWLAQLKPTHHPLYRKGVEEVIAAAFNGYRTDKGQPVLLSEWQEQQIRLANLQAELERVRADNKALDEWRADVTVSLQRPGGAFFVDVPQHIKDLVKERDDLRTLILALPKVEGEIEVKLYGDEFVVMIMGLIWLKCYKTDEVLINAIVALWQHRHGMEG